MDEPQATHDTLKKMIQEYNRTIDHGDLRPISNKIAAYVCMKQNVILENLEDN